MRNKKLAWLSVLTVSSIATPMLAAACNETKDYNKLVNVKLKDQASNKLAKDVTADDIDVSSTDKTLKLKVTSVNVSATDKDSVTVIIQVRDSSSKKTHTITKVLKGFKTEKGQETKDYNQLVNVKLKEQTSNKLAKDVTADDIEVSSTDKTLELKVTSVKVSATDKDSVTVIIQIKDTSSKKTHTITKVLKGFKTEEGQNNSNEGGANNDSGQGDQSTPQPQPQPENPGDKNPKDPNDGKDNDSGSKHEINPDVKEAYDIFSKHTKLSKSKKSWDFFAKANNGDPIYYDYNKKAFYAEKYDSKDPDKERTLLFSLEEGYSPKYGYNASWPADKDEHGRNAIYNKVKLVKLEDKFGFKFRVSKYDKKNTFPEPTLIQETILQEFKVPSEADVKGVLDSIQIGYDNKENIEEKDATKTGVKVPPEADGYTTHVESVTPKIGKGEVDVVIYLTYNIGDDVISSEKRTITIKGFKTSDLASKIKDVQIIFEGDKSKKLASEVTENELKAKSNGQDLSSDINVMYTLKADDYKGILEIKATFSTTNNSITLEREIDGFKKQTFDFDEFVNNYPKPTLNSEIETNKANIPAATVSADKIMLSEDYGVGKPVTVSIKSVMPQKDDKTILVVTVLFINTLNDEHKEKTYTFDGFKNQKEYRNNEAFKEAEKGNLFHYTSNAENDKAILDFIETGKGTDKHPLLKIDNNSILFNGKGKKSVKGVVNGLTLDPSAKHILTHTGQNTVAPAFVQDGKKQKSQEKGLQLVKTSTSVEIQFKLVLKNGTVDDKVYKFKLFDLNSDTGNSSQSNPGSSAGSPDDE